MSLKYDCSLGNLFYNNSAEAFYLFTYVPVLYIIEEIVKGNSKEK